MECERINELAATLTTDLPGSKGYLNKFSKACKQIKKNLTDDQRQIYMALAKEWTEKRLPLETQQRYARGNGSLALAN
jgi:hypothetical protein